MKSKKLGIMGGTFDPVHLGHLQTAKFIYEHLGLEKIIFVPAFIAPHKVGLEFAPAADRYRMTELATEPFPYFEVKDIELQRSGVSYTPEVDISSTGIRERVRRGLSIKGLVPESVEKYILEEHLYQS